MVEHLFGMDEALGSSPELEKTRKLHGCGIKPAFSALGKLRQENREPEVGLGRLQFQAIKQDQRNNGFQVCKLKK